MDKSAITSQLKQYVCTELLNQPNYPLSSGDALITGGLIDSFSLAQISVFIEDAFGVYLPDNELTVANMDTLDQIAERVLSRQR